MVGTCTLVGITCKNTVTLQSASLCASCEKKVEATLTNETLSFCEGMDEVENILVYICDTCGNICSIPAQSLSPIQQTIERLVESKAVSKAEDVTVELKSLVDKEEEINSKSEPNYHDEYPQVAAE